MNRRTGLMALVPLMWLGTAISAQVLDRPVAIVRLTDTVNIGQRELRQQVELLEAQLGQALNQEQRREVLEAQIGDVLLNQAAERARIRVSDQELEQALFVQRQQMAPGATELQFQQLISQESGLSWQTYRQEVRNRLIQEQFVLSVAQEEFAQIAPATAREIRQVYEENAQDFTSPAMVRFDHLFFDLRPQARTNAAEARRLAATMARRARQEPGQFQAMLNESLDDTRVSGGDFGYVMRGDPVAAQQLGVTFVNDLFDLEQGDISGVLESNAGLHIVRVTDRRSPRLLQLNDPVLPGESVTVRQQIEGFIFGQRQQAIFQEAVATTLAELNSEAEVTRFVDNLNW